MKIAKYFTLISLILTIQIYSFSSNEQDTSKVYFMHPFVVTGTRSQISIEKSPNYIDVITKEQIRNYNGRNLGDILQYQNGIYLKEYGSNGGLKTISIRGTSSEHTLVLMNGMRLNNFQNGIVDFSLLPIDNIERIEVVHGGLSALYGSDAVGGVVNILTSNPTNQFRFNLNTAVGSFGYKKYLNNISYRLKGLGFNLLLKRESGDDNYKYKINEGGETITKIRENSAFTKDNIYLSTDYTISKTNLLITSSYIKSKTGIPGSLKFPSYNANQFDDNLATQFLLTSSFLNNVIVRLAAGITYSYQNYKNPDPIFEINSFSKNIHYHFNPHVEYDINENLKIVAGAEYIEAKLDGVDYNSAIGKKQYSCYLSDILNLDIDNKIINNISIYRSLRYDNYSNADNEYLPKIGANIKLFDKIFFRTSYGTNYRVPTLNDLYYVDSWGNSGNPNLKPEFSKIFDAGLTTSTDIAGKLVFDISYYNIFTVNKIIWMPEYNWTFKPKNIGQVQSDGMVMTLNWDLSKYIKFELGHSITNAININSDNENNLTYNKQLIYTPREVSKVGFSVNYKFVSLAINNIIVGKRFVDETNTKFLSPYKILNVNLLLNLNIFNSKFMVKMEGNNLLNEVYQIIEDYPLPMRNYTLTFGFEY